MTDSHKSFADELAQTWFDRCADRPYNQKHYFVQLPMPHIHSSTLVIDEEEFNGRMAVMRGTAL